VAADGEPISGLRVAAIVCAQILYLLRGVVLVLAVPFSLFMGLISVIGLATFSRPIDHLLAEILLPASIALLFITILSFAYRQLRTPSAILAVAIAVVVGIAESLSVG